MLVDVFSLGRRRIKMEKTTFIVFVNKVRVRNDQACHSAEIVGQFASYEEAKAFVEASDVVSADEFDEEVGISEIPASVFGGGYYRQILVSDNPPPLKRKIEDNYWVYR
jgi:hypothetical protein